MDESPYRGRFKPELTPPKQYGDCIEMDGPIYRADVVGPNVVFSVGTVSKTVAISDVLSLRTRPGGVGAAQQQRALNFMDGMKDGRARIYLRDWRFTGSSSPVSTWPL